MTTSRPRPLRNRQGRPRKKINMSKRTVDRLWRERGYKSVNVIAQHYGVTWQAAERELRTRGYLSDGDV